MARTFNGTTDQIALNPGACTTLNGAITIAAVFKPTAFPASGRAVIWGADKKAGTSEDAGYMLRIDTSGYPTLDTQAGSMGGFLGGHTVVNQWAIGAVTKPSGPEKMKGYVYSFTSGTWTVAESTGTLANPVGTAEQLGLGCKVAGPVAFFTGAIAVAGAWGSVLTQAQLEGLVARNEAGEEMTWLELWKKLAPAGLWALNQAAPVEAVNDLTAGGASEKSKSGTTVTGGEPVEYSGEPPKEVEGGETYEGYSASNMPPASWQPYARSSPWNRLVPASPTVVPDSAKIVKYLKEGHGVGSPQPGNITVYPSYPPEDFSHPAFWQNSTHPEWTVKVEVPFDKELEGLKIKAPANIKPASGSDGHMIILGLDGFEYDFYQVVLVGKTIKCGGASKTPITGAAVGVATAANFALLAGVIRPEEIIGGLIAHALFYTTGKCASSLTFPGSVKPAHPTEESAYVYPAAHGASPATKAEEEALLAEHDWVVPPAGARIWLEMSDAEIEAIVGIKPWQVLAYKALAKYGAYCGDTSGGGFHFGFLGQGSYNAFGLPDPLIKYAEEHGIFHSGETGEPWVFKPADVFPWEKLRVITAPAENVTPGAAEPAATRAMPVMRGGYR